MRAALSGLPRVLKPEPQAPFRRLACHQHRPSKSPPAIFDPNTGDRTEAQKDEAPATQEGEKEANRMRRAKGISQQIWDATRGLLTLLGASAPFTYGIANAATPNNIPLRTLIGAVAAVVLGALGYFLAQGMTASRTENADAVAAKGKGAAYMVLTLFLIVQLLALPVAAGLQGWAVYQTLQGKDATNALNSELADRIELYAGAAKALYLVKGYCEKHVSDDLASDAFLAGCVRFNQEPPPTTDEARQIASKLR
jgi:hypothetical protein